MKAYRLEILITIPLNLKTYDIFISSNAFISLVVMFLQNFSIAKNVRWPSIHSQTTFEQFYPHVAPLTEDAIVLFVLNILIQSQFSSLSTAFSPKS